MIDSLYTRGKDWLANRGVIFWLISLVIVAILIGILIYLYYHPHYGLYPYNYLIDKCVDSQTLYRGNELRNMFPASVEFENNWSDIRKEAYQVLNLKNFNVWREFIAADEDFWRGWNIFTLRLYGVDIENNMERCPRLAKLLHRYTDIHTAVFSILEPGKVISPHYGPNKGVLRYHLGLIIPAGDCHLKVGNDTYYWQEGEGMMFDETYLHSAHNNTNQVRVVLYMDIPRLMPNKLLTSLNDWLLWAIENSSHNRSAIRKIKES